MDFKKHLKDKKNLIDKKLETILPLADKYPQTIHESMRYSVLAGGKRLRPILTIASAEAVGGQIDKVISVACALELIHTYSLIHDDLPAIDNDNYRRGKLTNHRVYGESAAILTGDALLTLAFKLMADVNCESKVEYQKLLGIIREIAEAAGTFGMIGGQMVDIQSEGKEVLFPTLEYIHIHKTGALILAAVRAGAILGGANDYELSALSKYAENIGLAFQIVDDVLDIEGDQEQLGKDIKSDLSKHKATYPAFLGIEASKKRAEELIEKAKNALKIFDRRADFLRMIADYILKRRG